jgi:DNA-binding transcriptional regulator YbjK
MTRIRLDPEERRAVIVTAIRRIHAEGGAITHGSVAKRCTVQTSPATVKHYFPTKADLVATCNQS